MTSKKALGDLRFNVSMSQDIDYKEANNECDIIEKDLDKLSKLEDIEEDLGVDLIKLLTADEIYYKAHGEIKSNIFDVSFYSFLILVRVYHSPYRKDDEHFAFGFKDYGKTWAFTREELEK